MPHFRPLMLLANRLSSIQSILSFERWKGKGYHHFEDEQVRCQYISFFVSYPLMCMSFLCILWRSRCIYSYLISYLSSIQGIGRIAVLATCLGMHLGANIVLFLLVKLVQLGLIVIPPPETTSSTTIQSLLHLFLSIDSSNTLQMTLQWTVYSIFLCLFHLGEYFSTCIYNPSVTTSDSFMINQSKAYTAAALVSFFCVRGVSLSACMCWCWF